MPVQGQYAEVIVNKAVKAVDRLFIIGCREIKIPVEVGSSFLYLWEAKDGRYCGGLCRNLK